MPKTILLIEDDLPIIDVYETAFKQAKFKVETIILGRDAIKRIKKIKTKKAKKPDLVLLDLILPDMNGIQVLREIRKQKEIEDLPVFILTNYGSRELKRMGFELKAEECITKTKYTPTRLVELVKERLRKK